MFKSIIYLFITLSILPFIMGCESEEIKSKDTLEDMTIVKSNPLEYNKPMQFFVAWNGGNAFEAVWIVAIGVIEENTADKFIKFINEKHSNGNKIILHSPGGSFIGAIKLGREIRKHQLNTYIANSINNPSEFQSSIHDRIYNDVEKGKCLSACSYAFLGGVDRYINHEQSFAFHQGIIGSQIGFHKFYNDNLIKNEINADTANKLLKLGLSKAQFLSGMLVTYMVDMGINPKFINVINSKKNNDIFYPNKDTLKEYDIINNRSFGDWKIIPYNNGIYMYAMYQGSIYPYNWFQQIGFFSSKKTNEVFLVLSAFDTIEKMDHKKSNIQDYNLIIWIEDKEYSIDKNNVFWAKETSKYLLYIKLNNNIIDKLLTTSSFDVSLRVPRVIGGCYGTLNLTKTDKKMIKLTLKNKI